MQMITLTSDWIDDDYYVAALKGKIFSLCPEARITDISHRVKAWNIAQAAYLVRNAFLYFPEGSIHIITVDSEPEFGKHLLAAHLKGHYFLCADNGLLGLLGKEEPEVVISLRQPDGNPESTFVSLDVFAEVACSLAQGTSLTDLGEEVKEYEKQVSMRPVFHDNVITGSVLHTDSYGNAHTNISREFFNNTGAGRSFRIYVQSKYNVIGRINSSYRESRLGDLLAIFNSASLLEIAIRNGNAAELLNLSAKSTVRIDFN